MDVQIISAVAKAYANFDDANDGLNIASFTVGTNFTYEAWIDVISVTGGNGFAT